MISCLARCRCGSTQALALSRFFKTDAISPARKSLKTTNEPGKVPPYVLKSESDWIGPPDKESHIRPTHFYQTPSESPARTAYRLAVEDAAKWNHDFWAKRNRDFFANREEFVRNSMKVGFVIRRRRTAWGVQRDRGRPQAAHPVGGTSCRRATLDMAIRSFQGWSTRRAYKSKAWQAVAILLGVHGHLLVPLPYAHG
jgi:hypothetical protein